MNWYDKSQFDLDSITPEQWQEINDRMVAIGYDWRGWEDAKRVYYKLPNMSEDQKKVIDAVLGKKEYIRQNDPKETKKIFDKAIRNLGRTYNLKEAGYILPNGALLDLSGKKWGNTGNIRGLDHREINQVTDMKSFLEMGAIRYFPEQPGVDIRSNPTPKQLDIIFSDVNNSAKGYTVELFNPKKGKFFNEYAAGVKGEKVVNDIKNFYSQTVAQINDWYRLAILENQLRKEAGWKENIAITIISTLSGFSAYFESDAIKNYMNKSRISPEKQQEVVNTVNYLTEQHKTLEELNKNDFEKANQAIQKFKPKKDSSGGISVNNLMETIKRHEGIKYTIYLDPSKKNYCIGAGFNLNRPYSRKLIESVGANYDLIMKGQQKINKEQVDQLLRYDIEQSIEDSKRFVVNYDNLHPDAKFVLVNMAYNMGLNKLMGFKNLKTALQNYDYESAYREMVNSKWMSQVKSRAVELANKMRSIVT